METKREEQRKIRQEPVIDNKTGRIMYYKIPNYNIHKNFLTVNEKKFFKQLIKAVQKINKNNEKKYLTIFSQVAVNRLVDINNRRLGASYIEIENKSIDFVLYDLYNDIVVCCIELDDSSHKLRQERDYIIDNIFADLIPLIHIPASREYSHLDLYNELIRKI